MIDKNPFSLLVVPDDEPPVLSGTPYEARARADKTEWHFNRPGNEDETSEAWIYTSALSRERKHARIAAVFADWEGAGGDGLRPF